MKDYLKQSQENDPKAFQQHERTGRPLGTEGFIERAERFLGRTLKKKARAKTRLNDN